MSPDSHAAVVKETETLSRSQLRNRQRKHTRRCLLQALTFARRSCPDPPALQANDLEEFRKSLYSPSQAHAPTLATTGFTCSWCSVWHPFLPRVVAGAVGGEEQLAGAAEKLESGEVQSRAGIDATDTGEPVWSLDLVPCTRMGAESLCRGRSAGVEPRPCAEQKRAGGTDATDTGELVGSRALVPCSRSGDESLCLDRTAGTEPSPCAELERAGGTDATDTGELVWSRVLVPDSRDGEESLCPDRTAGMEPSPCAEQERAGATDATDTGVVLQEVPIVDVFSSQWWSQVVTKPTQVAPVPKVGLPRQQQDVVVYRKVDMSLQSLSGTTLPMGKPRLPLFWTALVEKKANTDGRDGRVDKEMQRLALGVYSDQSWFATYWPEVPDSGVAQAGDDSPRVSEADTARGAQLPQFPEGVFSDESWFAAMRPGGPEISAASRGKPSESSPETPRTGSPPP